MAAEHDLMGLDELLEDRQGFIAKRLGRYELCFELASGGMATVYLARMIAPDNASLERLVALKLIHRHLAKDASFREMFLDEARIISRINHPNVCTVYDFGEERGIHFIAMELLQGESLHTVAKCVSKMTKAQRPKLWPAYCARIIADAAEGLHAAHEATGARGEPLEIVHRDVSPQNLFVGFDGSVRVVDFGIARAVDREHHTATGTLKGKFTYLAPEQIVSRSYDRRVDIWALGVVLWELLTRKRLFRRETEFATVDAIRTMAIPFPSEVTPDAPKELDSVVMKALDRSVSKRYATARELGRDLRRYLLSLSEPIEMAEVAELMRATFAEQYASRRTLMEVALAGATRSVPHVGRVEGERSETHDAITAVKAKAETSDAALEDPVEATEISEAPAPAPSPPASPASEEAAQGLSKAAWAAIGAVILVVVGASTAVGWALARQGSASAASLSTAGASELPHARPAESPGVEGPQLPESEPDELAAEIPLEPPLPERAAEVPPTSPRPARSTRPARAAASAPSEPGTLVIVSSPGWGLVEDSNHRRLGETLQPLQLPAGTHRVYVRRMGTGDPVPLDVRVEPGQTTRRTVRFTD